MVNHMGIKRHVVAKTEQWFWCPGANIHKISSFILYIVLCHLGNHILWGFKKLHSSHIIFILEFIYIYFSIVRISTTYTKLLMKMIINIEWESHNWIIQQMANMVKAKKKKNSDLMFVSKFLLAGVIFVK